MENIKWQRTQNEQKHTVSEISETLVKKHSGIVILDGPSGCGKTTVLHKLRCHTQRPVVICSYQDVVDTVMNSTKKSSNETFFYDNFPSGTIWAIEDLDYLRGKPYTRKEIYNIVQGRAKDYLIIHTGIDIKTWIADLFEAISDAEYYRASNI